MTVVITERTVPSRVISGTLCVCGQCCLGITDDTLNLFICQLASKMSTQYGDLNTTTDLDICTSVKGHNIKDIYICLGRKVIL